MKKLNVKLENCYGIRNLEQVFDFTKHHVYAIYAPNGAMKSSFAKTFRDLSEGVDSSDRIFPERQCARSITDESGNELDSGAVFVVSPYDEELGHTEKTSTLLVDNSLRKEYEQLHEAVDAIEEEFLSAMKEEAGIGTRKKIDLKKVISLAFTTSDDEFYRALNRVRDEVGEQKDAPWANVSYETVFDEKVLRVLDKPEVREIIADYVTKYNELIADSTYFKQGVFNYYNAGEIAKQLATHGFFDAKHTVQLNADSPLEITSETQLKEVIQKEKDQITNDSTLKKKFAALEKELTNNESCRAFRNYLDERPDLVPMLENVDRLREEVWKSYFKNRSDLYNRLLDEHQKAQKRRKEIEAVAAKQRTQWESVIEIFNDRFFVPFGNRSQPGIGLSLK